MTEIEINGDTLQFEDTEVRLRHPIKKSVCVDGVVVVLLDVPTGSIDNRNVIGFSKDGERLWEIEPISDDPTANQKYLNLVEKEGGLWAINPIGAECRLDVETGEFIEKRTKRW